MGKKYWGGSCARDREKQENFYLGKCEFAKRVGRKTQQISFKFLLFT